MLVRVENKANGKKKYTAVVADLGLAEKIPSGPKEEAKLKLVGTPYCMAPEVLRDKPYNELVKIIIYLLWLLDQSTHRYIMRPITSSFNHNCNYDQSLRWSE